MTFKGLKIKINSIGDIFFDGIRGIAIVLDGIEDIFSKIYVLPWRTRVHDHISHASRGSSLPRRSCAHQFVSHRDHASLIEYSSRNLRTSHMPTSIEKRSVPWILPPSLQFHP
jgi:hypothetical protein